MFTLGIIVASDKGSKGERLDKSGALIKEIMEKYNYSVEKYAILPDQQDLLMEELIHMSDVLKLDLVLTTGGTGFSQRDVTPEATLSVIERQTPESEAIRYNSFQVTPRAISRAVSGIRKILISISESVKESLNTFPL